MAHAVCAALSALTPKKSVAAPRVSRGKADVGRVNLASLSAPRRVTCRAARVAGVDIPNNKRIETALTYIYGVGLTTSKKILDVTGVENKRTRELDEEDLAKLREELAKTDMYRIEGDLRRKVNGDIKRLIDIQCYRGKRHQARLPCRGQKSKTNARTRKGKKIAIAGKKKAPTR